MKKLLTLLGLLAVLTGTATASYNTDLIRENPEYWDCVSYTIDFCNKNPEYIPCSVSYYPTFKRSHMIAVKILDTETVHVHDGFLHADYKMHNWFLDSRYYHFWIDEPVLRNWGVGRVLDNRDVVINA